MQASDSSADRAPLSAAAVVDVGAAMGASMAVSPFILAIDKAIVESASGRTSLLRGIVSGVASMLRRPHHALLANPAYWMMVGVYGATYTAANLIDTLSRRIGVGDAAHATAKLFGTTAINTSACIAKDVAFARMFGATSAAGGAMPRATIGLFGARDLLCVASAFTVPKPMAAGMASCGMEPSQAENAAQFISPVAMQVFCAPLHLLGLNLYNMPVATLRQRAMAVAATAPQTMLAFSFRMAPAFGIGGVLNTSLSSQGHELIRARFPSAAPVTAGPLQSAALSPIESTQRLR